jgi:Carboxypeptidase regulatory-like domain
VRRGQPQKDFEMRKRLVLRSLPTGFTLRAACFCGIILALSSCLSSALAQQTVTSATLGGRVEDASGAIIGGATLTITNLDTNQTRTVVSDEEGRYRFSYLPAGSYRLLVEHAGFSTLQQQLTVTLGQALDVPLRLAVASVTGSVQITMDVPLIEAARTQVAETILPREIDALPLNGRNYLDLALLSPAVAREHRKRSAIRGDFSRARHWIVNRRAAQPQQQLHS